MSHPADTSWLADLASDRGIPAYFIFYAETQLRHLREDLLTELETLWPNAAQTT